MYNQKLAEYFTSRALYLDEKNFEDPNVRKLVEQPWQQIKAEMGEAVVKTLCDVFFVEASAKGGLLDTQEANYRNALSIITIQENKNYLEDFHTVLMQQKHVLKQHSELTFQQMYNELQWKKGKTISIIEDSRKVFLSRRRCFLHQYRVPEIVESQLIMTLAGHTSTVCSCAFSPDGKRIVSGSWDKTLRLWNSETGSELGILTGHTSYVNTCAFSPDGKMIISGCDDNSLKIWDADTQKELLTLTGHTDKVFVCAFSPNGEMIVSGSADKTLKMWDVKTGKELTTTAGHTGEVTAFAFAPDGKTIVTGSQDKTLKSWDTASGREILSFTGHLYPVRSCSYSLSGEKIFSVNMNELLVWDSKTGDGNLLATPTSLDGSFINAFAFSPDGKKLVSASEDINLILWETETGEKLSTLTGHVLDVESCAFSPDGKKIVSGSWDKTLKLWDTDKGRQLATLTLKRGSVCACAFSPDGRTIASIDFCDKGETGNLKLWNTVTGNELNTLKEYSVPFSYTHKCTFSPNGKHVVFMNNSNLELWDVMTGEEIYSLTGHSSHVRACAFSPDGKKIVSGSYDKTLKIWSVEAKKELITLTGHTDKVNACAFSPDGKKIVSGSDDKTIKLWDAEKCMESATLTGHIDRVHICGFLADGKKIFSGSSDNTMKIWDIETGRELISLPWRISDATLRMFSPGGKKYVSGSRDNTITLWDTETGKELAILSGHKGYVHICGFTSDGKKIVSGSMDNTIKLWDAEKGLAIMTFFVSGAIKTVAISDCGSFIACGDEVGNFYMLSIQPPTSGRILEIKQTKQSPYVYFDNEKGVLLICGRIADDSDKIIEIFKAVSDELDLFYRRYADKLLVAELYIEYFRTGCGKMILDFFKRLEKRMNTTVFWYYLAGDEDMLETGEDFDSIIRVPFRLIEIPANEDFYFDFSEIKYQKYLP
jgi:WD40 repeat protein